MVEQPEDTVYFDISSSLREWQSRLHNLYISKGVPDLEWAGLGIIHKMRRRCLSEQHVQKRGVEGMTGGSM